MKMRLFAISIKSHCEAPDFEAEVEAPNKKKALEIFTKMARMDIKDCEELCPDCGGFLERRKEERQGGNFEEVSYCKGCGTTATP